MTEHPRSGRNRLFVVTGDGRRWLAKAGPSVTESWFYDQVGTHLQWVPGHTRVDDPTVVLIDYLDDLPSLHELSSEEPRRALSAFVSLAPALAELHAWPCDEAPAAIPALPRIDPIPVSAWVDGSEASRYVLRSIHKRELLCRALRDAHTGLGPQGLIHGDLKADNILCGPTEPLVIDWELSGRGFVGWDVGCVLGSMLALWIEGVNLDASGPDAWFEDALMPYAEICDAAQQLLAGYGKCADGGAPLSRSAIATYAASWLVVRSWAESLYLRNVNPRHLLRLVIAEGLVRNSEALLGRAA